MYPGAAAYPPVAYDVPRPAPPPRRRPRWPWILGALALVGLVVAVALLVAPPDRTQVPDVVGSSISVATGRLHRDGFKVTPVRDNSDKPRNTIIGQDPEGGSIADKGATVTINISDGRAIVAVPDVVGQGRRAARKALIDAGFLVDEVPTPSDTIKVDRVIAQDPSGRGAQAAQGSTVQIQVSTGPEQIAVVDVTGKTEDAARAALEQAGFRVAVQPKEDAKKDPGTVLAQNPAGGRAARGSTVTLTVATEPKQIAVPDVVGRSQNTATKTLSGAGFEVGVQEVAVDTPGQDGLVQKQEPAGGGGKKIDRGSTVTITVGRFDPALSPDPSVTTPTPPASTTTAPAAPIP
jgi:serine/threonine-protein kinase